MMNGPGSAPNKQGDGMANSASSSPETVSKKLDKQFSPKDMHLGKELMYGLDPLEDEQEFMKTVIQRARDKGYAMYSRDVPVGTRRYIQYIIRKQVQQAVLHDKKIAEALGKTKSPTEKWYEEVDPHTLHPEDEADIIDALNSSNQ